jgi:hypothetical protein
MAIAYDTNSQGEANTTDTVTVSHTCSGANRLLIVAVAYYNGATPPLGTMEYNSVGMTLLAETPYGSATSERHALYGLKAPATGANDIVFTISGDHSMGMAAISLTGVDQTTPWDIASADTNTVDDTKPISVDIDSETDDWVIGSVSWWNQDGGLNDGAGVTRQVQNDNAAVEPSIALGTKAGETTCTFGWSFDANEWGAMAAININKVGPESSDYGRTFDLNTRRSIRLVT